MRSLPVSLPAVDHHHGTVLAPPFPAACMDSSPPLVMDFGLWKHQPISAFFLKIWDEYQVSFLLQKVYNLLIMEFLPKPYVTEVFSA